jgi:Domain of unknown function (DUF4367)
MDDRFMHELRREPPPAFSRSLRERLRGLEDAEPSKGFRLHPALAGVAVVVVAALLFMLPSVRAAAQNMLDLFRVRNFAAVPFDATRLEALRERAEQQQHDPGLLAFEKQEVLQEPGPAKTFDSPQVAATATGLTVRTPSYLPSGITLQKTTVMGEARTRLTLNAAKVEKLLSDLDVHDVVVPHEYDGQSITVRVPSSVRLEYASSSRKVELMQADSPEVTMPPGADFARLGEIGLRVLGLSATEAHRMATTIDWRSTLVVPLPIDATRFNEVTVHGAKALLISSTGGRDAKTRDRQLLIWPENGRVYALGGNLNQGELVEMAESVR